MWAFSQKPPVEFQNIIFEEARRIIPLLNEDNTKKWKKMIKNQDFELYKKIRLFWIEKDARPTTKGNERLLEHWERISYARKNFTKNKNSVYETDDRGTIYEKYGEPDKKKCFFICS